MVRPIRVLVVDDSPLVRKTVRRLLEEEPRLTVVGTAADGREAIDAALRLSPDVVTLDISMPVMDGLACLGELVKRLRQRVVILSTLAEVNSFTTFKALALGAVDFVTKPGGSVYLQTLEELGRELREKVLTASAVLPERLGRRPAAGVSPPREAPPAPRPSAPPAFLRKVVGVGGSTGGAAALETVVRALPVDLPAALLVVQHLPPGFSASFARYLGSVGRIAVRQAEQGERVEARTVYLAPGGKHLRVQRTPGGLFLRLDESTAPHGGFRPSIDILFYSLAAAEREGAVGLLLSGMGEDGASGMGAIRKLGGRTLVQDEASSVVYGMAERAVRDGVVDDVVALHRLPGVLLESVRRVA